MVMVQVLRSKQGLTLVWLCTAVFCLLLTVGCVISPRRTLGGGGGTPTPTPTATPTPNPAATGKLYVSNNTTNSILRFDNALTANANVTPAATIVGAGTTLNFPGSITLDAANDRLYIADTGDISVLIYDNISTKNGPAVPSRIIAGASTTLTGPSDVAFDRVRNLLYVADDTNIIVFSSASIATGGNVAPARVLTTTFGLGVSAIFLDSNNDRLYAVDTSGNAIDVYDNVSTLPAGQITANRTIQGAATQLGNPVGVQVDGLGRLVVCNAGNAQATPAVPVSITIYANAAGASANQAPVAQIAGNRTSLSAPSQTVVDPSGTETLYIADPGAASVIVFAGFNTANGNILPTRSITGSNTGLVVNGPVGVALDNTR